MSMGGRRHLVLVRAGEKSLHRQWLEGAEARSWDLIVSWYGDEPYLPVADELVINRKGGKWDIIHAHLIEMPELLDRYEYFWLPDDDIATDGATIDAMFAMMEREQLQLGQPALTVDSYFSFPHTLASPSFRLRYTTCIEVMVPCLSRPVLRRTLPIFPDTKSGFRAPLHLDAPRGRQQQSGGHSRCLDDASHAAGRPVSRRPAEGAGDLPAGRGPGAVAALWPRATEPLSVLRGDHGVGPTAGVRGDRAAHAVGLPAGLAALGRAFGEEAPVTHAGPVGSAPRPQPVARGGSGRSPRDSAGAIRLGAEQGLRLGYLILIRLGRNAVRVKRRHGPGS